MEARIGNKFANLRRLSAANKTGDAQLRKKQDRQLEHCLRIRWYRLTIRSTVEIEFQIVRTSAEMIIKVRISRTLGCENGVQDETKVRNWWMKEATLNKHGTTHRNICYGDTTQWTEICHKISIDWRYRGFEGYDALERSGSNTVLTDDAKIRYVACISWFPIMMRLATFNHVWEPVISTSFNGDCTRHPPPFW